MYVLAVWPIVFLLLWLCGDQAMNDAMKHAEDALTRFVKSSTRLARPAEVEKKRVDLMVRELLTIRPYSAPSQIKIRSVVVCQVQTKARKEGGRLGCNATCNVEGVGLRNARVSK